LLRVNEYSLSADMYQNIPDSNKLMKKDFKMQIFKNVIDKTCPPIIDSEVLARGCPLLKPTSPCPEVEP
jgi:hypothetical protein